MKNIKAIALDMDGTLLTPQGQISESLINLLERIREKGVKLFIATGRTQKEIQDVLPKHLPFDGYVAANGMKVYTDSEQLIQHSLDPSLLQQIITNARNQEVYYEIHPNRGSRFALIEDKPYFIRELENQFPETLLKNEIHSRMNAIRNNIHWVKDLNLNDIAKVYFFSTNINKIDKWKKDLTEIQQITPFSTFSSSLHNVEVMVNNVSKGSGLALLLDQYGIDKKHLLSAGDGENDLPMFKLSGHSVAMKNATTSIQQQADEVTTHTYEQDGLYYFLKELFNM